MTVKRCAFCGSTRNVTYEDPSKGPVCQTCWFLAGDEGEKEEKEEKEEKGKKPARQGPGGAPEEPEEGTGR
ncbi:MAG: hypothetical protein HYY89_05535 [candidate division NC10 bacterium]|nr:hypothetical protein [candidate division NC10 bacterium]